MMTIFLLAIRFNRGVGSSEIAESTSLEDAKIVPFSFWPPCVPKVTFRATSWLRAPRRYNISDPLFRPITPTHGQQSHRHAALPNGRPARNRRPGFLSRALLPQRRRSH